MKLIRPCLLSLALLATLPCMATEGGGNSYPVGVETNLAGVMRPEGFTHFLYFSYYDAGRLNGDDGNRNAAMTRFGLQSQALSWRATYVWRGVKFLGANVETRAVLPLVNLDRKMARALPGGGSANLDASGSGLGDVTFMPVALGWHGKHLHQIVGIETFIPVGSYDEDRLLNTGRNTTQVAPVYGVTWFSGDGWEASAKLRYAVNGKNDATNYRSGDEATLEYSAGYQVSQKLQLGVNGYMYRQTSDDHQNGAAVNGNGNRGEVDAIGPYLRYSFTPKFTLMVKYQKEFNARNKSEGDRLWLQTILPF